MTKEELTKLKENKGIKFIYKIPCSLYEEGFEYIIVGDINTFIKDNIRAFSLDDWFLRMYAGSLLPYVCSTLTKSGKIKEYLNIYEKPDLMKLRKFILSNEYTNEIIQECLWGIQVIEEFKVNRPDVFKTKCSSTEALNKFMKAVDPIYKMNLNERK